MPNLPLSTILLIIAAILSLPGGLFVAWLISRPGIRFLGLLGGLIGAALTAFGLWFFVTQGDILIDAVSWFLGAFLACSMGVATGALLMGFLFGGGRGSDMSAQEI
jgi:hypothetical protein